MGQYTPKTISYEVVVAGQETPDFPRKPCLRYPFSGKEGVWEAMLRAVTV